MKICFICHANICRSFIAQEILKNLLNKNNISNITVISRGTYALSYLKVPQKIKDFLSKKNIPYTNEHIPTQYSKQDLSSSDLIFVMTNEQLDSIIDKYAEFSEKIYLLSNYALDEDTEIEDPISYEGKKFEKIADKLNTIIEKLYLKLTNLEN